MFVCREFPLCQSRESSPSVQALTAFLSATLPEIVARTQVTASFTASEIPLPLGGIPHRVQRIRPHQCQYL